jgi:hypothetical protein
MNDKSEGSSHSLIKVLSWHLPERNKENQEKPHPGQLVSKVRFEPNTPEHV